MKVSRIGMILYQDWEMCSCPTFIDMKDIGLITTLDWIFGQQPFWSKPLWFVFKKSWFPAQSLTMLESLFEVIYSFSIFTSTWI